MVGGTVISEVICILKKLLEKQMGNQMEAGIVEKFYGDVCRLGNVENWC